MSKLSFRARALDASKPMPIYLAEDLPDLPEYSAINRAVPQMPSGMEKEEECEHHLQRAICTGLIIPTPEVCLVQDLEFYEKCYPPDYKMPKQHIHMQPLWQEQETPEYDMDSEDERWLRQQRRPELTELKFEQMMDKLEKSSGQTVVTLSEAKLLLERHDDLVISVYDYWLNKRLKTQQPLILAVKTESRVGQSTNNPYLAFRRRTEKMQTRKNRKNDESSYEKMLKLRRDLARAVTLLETVARRERLKRDLMRLTAMLAEKRYHGRDFAGHLLAEFTQAQPPRPAFSTLLTSSGGGFRRELFPHHFPPRAPPTPVDQPRQREKRPYKRRKHRHHTPGPTHVSRDTGVYSSSSDEGAGADSASPQDDGPFTFRRKPGCFYEMPTATLYGDPLDPKDTSKEGPCEHEINNRFRFTLTSINHPYQKCIGFARRRIGRGGRVILDRVTTPLDDLWPKLPFNFPKSTKYKEERDEEVELETKPHRQPKEMSRDYHTGGKHPWRRAFRHHLSNNPTLWSEPTKCEELPNKSEEEQPIKSDVATIKSEPRDIERREGSSVLPQNVQSDISLSDPRTIDGAVVDNLKDYLRKRSYSACSGSSYDSDASLEPVEQEFDKFINEVNKKWLHFRPKTPPPAPPLSHIPNDQLTLTPHTAVSVHIHTPSGGKTNTSPITDTAPFTTSEFTLSELYPDMPTNMDADNSGNSLDITGDDLLNEDFTGLTDAQVESILSETDLKALTEDDKKNPILLRTEDILDELVKEVNVKDSFLSQGQSTADGHTGSGPRLRKRKERGSFGSSVVNVAPLDEVPIIIDMPPVKVEHKLASPPKPAPKIFKEVKMEVKAEKPLPVPTSNIIIENVSDVPHVKVEPIVRKRKEDIIEDIQISHNVQLKTLHTKHSPLKKHIITTTQHRRPEGVTLVTSEASPQIVTVAVSDSLKLRLQNHMLPTQVSSGATVVGLVQNGPFTVSSAPMAVAVSAAGTMATVGRDGMSPTVGVSTSVNRRLSAPVVHLSAGALQQKTIHQPMVVAQQMPLHHVAPNKLKVLHSLTHSQRTQLLAQSRSTGLTQVVSLASLGDAKASSAGGLQLKTAPGSVTQFFELKGGQLAKAPHLVNVVRQPQPGKAIARLDINDAKKRGPVVATFDGSALKGNLATTNQHRLSVSLDGRQIVRTVRAPHVRHQIQLKNRTLQVSAPQIRNPEASTSITIQAPLKTASIPSSLVANLLPKNVQVSKGGQKIAISGATGQTLAANVQAIAFTSAQLKARQARLITQPRPAPVAEIVEANTASVSSSSAPIPGDTSLEAVSDGGEASTNGTVRRRPTDSLPMEVT